MKSWYQKLRGKWLYVLTARVAFYVPELALPDMRVFSLAGKPIARVERDLLTLLPGYAWDGCTVIGRIVETAGTLRASLVHDFLYQLAEQPRFVVPYSQAQVDGTFRRYLPCLAKPIYYLGVRLFGRFFYGDEQESLVIRN